MLTRLFSDASEKCSETLLRSVANRLLFFLGHWRRFLVFLHLQLDRVPSLQPLALFDDNHGRLEVAFPFLIGVLEPKYLNLLLYAVTDAGDRPQPASLAGLFRLAVRQRFFFLVLDDDYR